MVFTREDILKILNALLQLGRKDSEFKDANTPLNSDDEIAILQDGINKKVSINNLLSTLGLLKKDDFINVSDRYDEYYIQLSEAVTIIAKNKRKNGLVITFLNLQGNWKIYQFNGELDNFIDTNYWKDLFDFKYPIINSILPDEEDLTLTYPDNSNNSFIKFKDKEYDPDAFSGLGVVNLRKNIINGKNILTQDMVNKPNTIYNINYDYDLNEKQITIPSNSILKINNGSLNNGIIPNRFRIINPRGDACIPVAVVKYINIDDYYEGDLIAALDKIQKIYINTKYPGTNDHYTSFFINLSAGATYSIKSHGLELNRRFSFGCKNGVALIHLKLDFDEPTNIIKIVTGKEAANPNFLNFCGMQILISNARNVILFQLAEKGIGELSAISSNIVFENIKYIHYSGEYPLHFLKSFGYADNYKFDRINLNNKNKDYYNDIPQNIDIALLGSGDGISINRCGETTCFLLGHKNNTLATNCVNPRIINMGGNLTMINCYSETGALYIYKGLLTMIGCLWQNEHLKRLSCIYLDYEPLLEKQIFSEIVNPTNTVWGPYSMVNLIGSKVDTQKFGNLPDPNLNYKAILNYSGSAIINYDKTYLYALHLRNGTYSVNYSYNREYCDSYNPKLYISIKQGGWYPSIRINPEYTEERTETTYDLYMFFDKSRNLGIHYTNTFTPTNNKNFVNYTMNNFGSCAGLELNLYRSSKENKYLFSGFLSSLLINWILIYDSKYWFDIVPDRTEFESLPPEPQKYTSAKWINGNKNVEIIMSSLPTSGEWSVGDIVIVNNVRFEFTGEFWGIIDRSVDIKQIPQKALIALKYSSLLNSYSNYFITVESCTQNTNYFHTPIKLLISFSTGLMAEINRVGIKDIYGTVNGNLRLYKKNNIIYLYFLNYLAKHTLLVTGRFYSEVSGLYDSYEDIPDDYILIPYTDILTLNNYPASVKTFGSFSEKPNHANIPQGFAYYCTDKQTTEGATNGIMIYYKGNNVWVDALGRVVS